MVPAYAADELRLSASQVAALNVDEKLFDQDGLSVAAQIEAAGEQALGFIKGASLAGRACRLESVGFPECAVPGDAQRPVRDRVIATGYDPHCSVGPTPGGRTGGPAGARWAASLVALGVALASRRRSR